MTASPTASLPVPRLLGYVVALEVASGLPYGVANDLVPMWLLVHGTDLAALGAMTLVGLPWTLKALWAPLVDRRGTFRRWMSAAMAVALVLTGLLATLAPSPLTVAGVLVALAFASATQDVALDGWLVAAVPAEQQGRATGVRVASYRGAMAVAGGGGVVIGEALGWDWAFGAAAALMAVLLLVELRLPDAPQAPPGPVTDWAGTLGRWLSEPGVLVLLAFSALYKLGDAAMAPMVKPYLVQAGLTPSEVGLLTSTIGAVLVSVGAVAGGDLVSRVGMRRGVLALGGAQALSNLVYAGAAATGGRAAAVVASVTESLTSGLGTAALLSLTMRAAVGPQAATRFALLSAAVGLTRTLSGAVSGIGVEQLGYARWFALTAAMALPALALVPRAVAGLTVRDVEPTAVPEA